MSLLAAAAGVQLETQAVAGNQAPHYAYGFYVASAFLSDQVLWSAFGALAPEGMAVLTQNSLLALACLALYRVHLWREQINPFITFASVSGVTTVGAALSQSQNIAKIFAHVFGTAEAPAEKK